MPAQKTCDCGHLFTDHSNKTGAVGCTLCACALNRAGQGTSVRKFYARDDHTLMCVDLNLEYGPWRTKDGLLA